MTTLFSPITLADLKLSRRVVIVAFGRYFISNPDLVNRIRN